MNAGNFKVIRGGLDKPPAKIYKKYISGYLTDTRLMGVVGLFLNWELTSEDIHDELHQYFYLDVEEGGIESYTGMQTSDEARVSQFETKMITCLGGNKVYVTQKEAAFLLQSFSLINKNMHQKLPEPSEDYNFLLSESADLTVREYTLLMQKMCGNVEHPYGIVNYYLMRVFANDCEGAAFLSEGNSFSEIPEIRGIIGFVPRFNDSSDNGNNTQAANIVLPSDFANSGKKFLIKPWMTATAPDFKIYNSNDVSSLCRNDIEIFKEGDTISYVSESLIEGIDGYTIVVSEIYLDPETNLVRDARLCSSFRISATEAAMKMTHSEFLTVYDLCCERDIFMDAFQPYVADCTETEYETGNMYIRFNRDNGHVNNKTFQIHEDIHTMFYVSEFGQLLVASYNVDVMKKSEEKVRYSSIATLLDVQGRFQFKDSVLYDFVGSDMEDFMTYLDFIRNI